MAIISSDEARRAGLIGGPVPVPAQPWPERDEDLACLDRAIADAESDSLVTSPSWRQRDDDNLYDNHIRAAARIEAMDRARRLRRIRAALG